MNYDTVCDGGRCKRGIFQFLVVSALGSLWLAVFCLVAALPRLASAVNIDWDITAEAPRTRRGQFEMINLCELCALGGEISFAAS